MEIQARFPYDKINHAQDTDGHLVLSLIAPSIDWLTQRPKLAVLPVIDLSGSMQGSKLEYAKKSVRKLVDQLTPGDVCGLMAFESNFHPLVKPEPVTPAFKEKLRAAIDNLHIMGGTNYSGGLLGAIETMKSLDLPLSFVQRVIFFTDGQPTEGVTSKEAILKLTTQALGTSATTISFFGYGDVGGGVYNGCDQEFLVECSKQAKGNYAYVKDPDAALMAFGKELGGLLSAYATDILITVEPVNGHQITKVVSDVEAEEEDVTGQVEIKLSDLLAEETRNIVLATKFTKQAQAFPRQSTVFNVHLVYSVFSPDGAKEVKSEDIKAKVTFVKPSEAQKEPNKEVDAIVGLAQMIRAQIAAEEQAKKGEYKTAASLLEDMARQLQNRGHERLGGLSRGLSARVGRADLYASSSGYLRSVQSAGTRAYGVSSMDGDAQADLIGANVSVSNSLMDHMVTAFTEPSQTVQPVVQPAVANFGDLHFGGQTVTGLGIDALAGGALPIGGAPWVVPQPQQTSPEEVPVEKSSGLKGRIKQSKSKTRW